jgi:hypothetical protein
MQETKAAEKCPESHLEISTKYHEARGETRVYMTKGKTKGNGSKVKNVPRYHVQRNACPTPINAKSQLDHVDKAPPEMTH